MAQPNYAILRRTPGQTKYKIEHIGNGRRKQRWQKYMTMCAFGRFRFSTFSHDMTRLVGSVESGISEYKPK